jgi:cytochrome c556
MEKILSLLPGALVLCGAITFANIQTLRAQDKAPGLTAIDHADDVIMARQALMDGLEDEMMTIEMAPGGKEPTLPELKASAFRANTLLMAFPHLFPPQTKAAASADAPNTAADPKIWENFADFYAKTQASAAAAFEAGQAANLEVFREQAKKLRDGCDGCHAQYMHVEQPPTP